MAQPAQQPTGAPSGELGTDGFKVGARRKATISQLLQTLAPLTFVEVAQELDVLALINVQSRDIQKNPYLFSLVKLGPNDIEISYTIAQNTSPSKRRLEILRYFINLISLIDDLYDIDHVQLLQVVESSLKDMTEYVSASYDQVYALYDALKSEHALLKKKLASAEASNERLSLENLELKSRLDALTLRVRELETMSDDVLMLKMQDWLGEHRNEINLSEFSKVHRVHEQRVEEVLNRMVQAGYLKLRE